MPALTVTWMVFVLSAFYPFENKNKIISIFVYGGNQLIGKYKGNLSWIYNYSEPCIATESTKWTMCIISLIESFMLLKQMGKRWAWAKKAMVSFISPKPDDEKRILRTNFQSATKFMWTSRANSNQNRISLDFLHTFIVILRSITRSLDNSNPPLSRDTFCFPLGYFYKILPSITWTTF